MFDIFPPRLSDFYKVSHKPQYWPDTEVLYGNLTGRSSRMDLVDRVVFFGLQYFVKEYLLGQFNNNFFWLHEDEFDCELHYYKQRLDNALGGNNDVSHWQDLYKLGYLPLEIKALPEGALVPMRVPLLTVRNTRSEFFWLGQWMETLLSNVLWHPLTCATIGHQFRKLLNFYAEETSDLGDFVALQGHDFSMRGHTSPASSFAGGAGHLVNFVGTDTIGAIDFLERYYGADSSKEIVGISVPATEHSVMTCNGEEGEFDTIKRLITEVYPSGNISIVADSYNLWRVLTDYLPRLKDIILNRDGKVIFRPDSGNPVDIICGCRGNVSIFSECVVDPKQKGVVQLLYEVFGGAVNSKGYVQLNPKVGVIYGDGINMERCRAICQGLKDHGFASTNIAFGLGSYTYQLVSRDTFGLAFKATAIKRSGSWRAIYKDPITDSGMKKSARGLLMVVPSYINNAEENGYPRFELDEYKLVEDVTEEMEASAWNCLQPVFVNGDLVRTTTLKEIRSRLNG